MSPPSIEKLARQVAEAYSAAFPQSTMSRSQPQAQTQAQIVARYAHGLCAHPISTCLAAKIPDSHTCPTCTINDNIKAVQRVQEQFAERGGIFASRQIAHHKTFRKRWRVTKLACIRTVTLFETLVADPHLPAEDTIMVKAALDIWNENKVALTSIPGVMFESGADNEPTEEEHETAQLMTDLLKLILAKEMTAEDKECHQHQVHWETPNSPQKSLSMVATTESAESIAPEVMPAFPVQQNPTSSNSSPDYRPPSVPRPPKSILKRKGSLSPKISGQYKRIRMTDVVTISPPHLNLTNASPFVTLANSVTFQTHDPHTSADNKRPIEAFRRGTQSYDPGNWASSETETKAETSGFKKHWALLRREVQQELDEASRENFTAQRLRSVAGAWSGIWWISKVVKKVNMEKLKEKLEGS
jgi:hypothetical protein